MQCGCPAPSLIDRHGSAITGSRRVRLGREDLRVPLRTVGLGASGCATVRAPIFVEIPCGKDKQQSLSRRGCDATTRAIEKGGIEGTELTL